MLYAYVSMGDTAVNRRTGLGEIPSRVSWAHWDARLNTDAILTLTNECVQVMEVYRDKGSD